MSFKNLNDVIDAPAPIPSNITDKTKEVTQAESHRFRGSVRIALGKFYTDEEYEARRKRILNTPLP